MLFYWLSLIDYCKKQFFVFPGNRRNFGSNFLTKCKEWQHHLLQFFHDFVCFSLVGIRLPLKDFVCLYCSLTASVSFCLPLSDLFRICCSLSASAFFCSPLLVFVCVSWSLSTSAGLCPLVCLCLPLKDLVCFLYSLSVCKFLSASGSPCLYRDILVFVCLS